MEFEWHVEKISLFEWVFLFVQCIATKHSLDDKALYNQINNEDDCASMLCAKYLKYLFGEHFISDLNVFFFCWYIRITIKEEFPVLKCLIEVSLALFYSIYVTNFMSNSHMDITILKTQIFAHKKGPIKNTNFNILFTISRK